MTTYSYVSDPTVKDIIEKTERSIILSNINPGKEKYRELVLCEAEKYQLKESQVKNLAYHLKIDIPSPPKNAKNWTLSLSKRYMSAKYTNPVDPREYIVMVSSKSIFGIQGVIHHTSNGYLDTSWFTDFVTNLDQYAIKLKNDLTNIPRNIDANRRLGIERELFSKNINDPINRAYSRGMTIEQVRAAHAFVNKYIPVVEGICENCFQLNFPASGAGARWASRAPYSCEVRLSLPKPDGRPSQQKLYLTHNYIVDDDRLHVKWNGIYIPEFTRKLRQEDTHICWKVYDYERLVTQLPIVNEIQTKFELCKCKKIV